VRGRSVRNVVSKISHASSLYKRYIDFIIFPYSSSILVSATVERAQPTGVEAACLESLLGFSGNIAACVA
jgi:hypothetical protein